MILCLDVGNSHIYGGVFHGEQILLRFRHTSANATSDEIGIFLKSVLRENNIDHAQIAQVAFCSVVPRLDYSVRAACMKYLGIEPFVLQAGVKTGLKITCRNPAEVGADRIANAIAAINQFPNENLIVIDFGTAITFCVITSDRSYLGGIIMPGLKLSMEVLQEKTAKLPSVEIVKAKVCIGRDTIDSIQSGIYFGALGSCHEIIKRIKQEAFPNQEARVLGTGGFAGLFEDQYVYDYNVPDLVLQGLLTALQLNG